MSRMSLSSLKNAFASRGNTQTNSNQGPLSYPFWNMEYGQSCVVRFLPDLDETNAQGFLIERMSHNLTIAGKRRVVPCLSMYGKDCPVCAKSQEFYGVNDEVNGRRLWRKRQYMGQVLVVKDPTQPNAETGKNYEGQIMPISISFQIYNIIKDAFSSDELEHVPFDFSNGYDFTIKRTEQGQYASYVVGTKFAPRPRGLTPEELDLVSDKIMNLKELLPDEPDLEYVTNLLEQDLTGGGELPADVAPASAPAAPAQPATAQPAPAAAPATAQPAPAADPAPAGGGDDVNSMLAAIRARRAQS